MRAHQSHRIARLAVMTAISAGFCLALGATDIHGSLMVRATVAPAASIELASQPTRIAISALDLERGYAEISTPVGMHVRCNSREGYLLEVLPVSPLFTSVAIRGLGADVSLGPDGGTLAQRWQHAQSVDLALTYRFYLAPGLVPGEYPWPLRLQVRALGVNP
jgi:hypothetical protein